MTREQALRAWVFAGLVAGAKQAATYWPEGTVFVSVVDPGVGTERKSAVLQTCRKEDHCYI